MSAELAAPFRTLAAAAGDWWREWVRLAALNLAWIICCLTIVLAPPATMILFYVAYEVQRGRDVTPADLLRAGRRHFLRSWLWFLPNALVALLVAANVLYYRRSDPTLAFAVFLLLALGVVLWLAVQLYVPPYLMVQERPRLGQAYRNALLTCLASPLYTAVVLVAVGLVLATGVRFLPLLFLGGPCLVALIAAHAVADRLDRFGVRGRGGASGRRPGPPLP